MGIRGPAADAVDGGTYEALEARLKAILPEEYQQGYEDVQPVSMGSAGLKYDADGAVAWDEMWDTFCDLAMAGGPPHKGKLLEPATRAQVDADPEGYARAAREICRGITLVSDLMAQPSPDPGWVRVACLNETAAGWLLRAITMENVAARVRGATLDLPAGPHFRIEKEIKNVVTVIAKTTHYWMGHMVLSQRRAIGELFTALAAASPLVEPVESYDGRRADAHEPAFTALADAIRAATGLAPSAHRYAGWLGLACPSVRAAIWMMRALVASNVLARREETVLFVPVNPAADPGGARVAAAVARVHRFATARGVC
jgi:sirohydrochlorin cobaltochelatase